MRRTWWLTPIAVILVITITTIIIIVVIILTVITDAGAVASFSSSFLWGFSHLVKEVI